MPLHRSLLRRSVFTLFYDLEEHCVTEDGNAVAQETIMPVRVLTGIKEIDQKLDKLARREANKIARSAVNAGLTVLSKTIRKNLDSEDISPELKDAVKDTVGKRLETGPKAAKNGASAKAGFGVGKNTRSKLKRLEKKKAARGEKRGVGVNARNVHWFALGTKRRITKKGHVTGSIKPVTAVRRAASAASGLRGVIEAKARERLQSVEKSL